MHVLLLSFCTIYFAFFLKVKQGIKDYSCNVLKYLKWVKYTKP